MFGQKYTLQHTGRPFSPSETIHESDWKDCSKHSSEAAAWKAVDKHREHLSPGSWDDHYRVISPDGHRCDRIEFGWEQDSIRAAKESKRWRESHGL
jgi:hypothetical protein